MFSRDTNDIIGILPVTLALVVGIALLIPQTMSAQEQSSSMQHQIQMAQQEVDNLKRSIEGHLRNLNENESETNSNTEHEVLKRPHIKLIDSHSGGVGSDISLRANAKALGDDWQLHFGDGTYEPVPRNSIAVAVQSNGGGALLSFDVPKLLTPTQPCEDIDRAMTCKDEVLVDEGTYPIRIESENGKTNIVNFTVTKDGQGISPAGQIKSISPHKGAVETEVQMDVTGEALEGGWRLHFGKGFEPIDEGGVVVHSVGQPELNGARHTVSFTVPTELEKERPDCEGTLQDPCPAQAYPYQPTPPGTYPIWIENENGRTNTVRFRVTNTKTDEGDLEPKRDEITLTDKFKWSDFTAKLSYRENNVWKYQITGALPNPCHGFHVQYFDSTNQLFGWVTKPSGDRGCTSVVEEVSKTGTLEATADTDFKFRVSLNETDSSASQPPEDIEDIQGLMPSVNTLDKSHSTGSADNISRMPNTQAGRDVSGNRQSVKSMEDMLNRVRQQALSIFQRL